MLIAITGYKFSGKSTVADILSHQLDCEVFSFATTLKRTICALTGCTMDQLEDYNFKENKLVPEYLFPYCADGRHNYRSLLQGLGDYMRDKNENIFVDSTLSICGSDAIISDLRFINEAKAIKDRGGIIIRVLRDSVKGVGEHKSETQIDMIEPDYLVYNNGSIEQLENELRLITAMWKIFD